MLRQKIADLEMELSVALKTRQNKEGQSEHQNGLGEHNGALQTLADNGAVGHKTQSGQDEYDNTLGQHNDTLQTLADYGASDNLFEESFDLRRVNIGLVVHDEPQLLLDFILQDAGDGAFQRRTIRKVKNGERIVFWLHYQKGRTKKVGYLLQLSKISSIHGIKVKPIMESVLAPAEQLKLAQLIHGGNQNPTMAKVSIDTNCGHSLRKRGKPSVAKTMSEISLRLASPFTHTFRRGFAPQLLCYKSTPAAQFYSKPTNATSPVKRFARVLIFAD